MSLFMLKPNPEKLGADGVSTSMRSDWPAPSLPDFVDSLRRAVSFYTLSTVVSLSNNHGTYSCRRPARRMPMSNVM